MENNLTLGHCSQLNTNSNISNKFNGLVFHKNNLYIEELTRIDETDLNYSISISRQPNIEEIMSKINEIIKVINKITNPDMK